MIAEYDLSSTGVFRRKHFEMVAWDFSQPSIEHGFQNAFLMMFSQHSLFVKQMDEGMDEFEFVWHS